MSKTAIIDLRQQRAQQIADARALQDTVEAANRDFTQEEQSNWDAMMNTADTLRQRIEREERLLNLEAELPDPITAATRPNLDGRSDRTEAIEFRSRGMQGTNRIESDWRNQPEWRRLLRTGSSDYVGGFDQYLRGNPVPNEVRALQADLDTAGGYLMAPIQLVDRLIKAIDDQVYLRQWATVFAVPNADSLGVPTLENDPADADWTSELATGSEDSTMSFGRRELHPHPLAKRLKISRKLMMKVPSVDTLTIQRLAYKFAITEEKAYLTGSGSGQPLGVFTASASGVPTSQDVSTGNTTTAVTFDGLIEAKYALKQQYWPNARWLGHRNFFKMTAKLKDGDGQYLWRESVRVGEPDRLLGGPVAMSEYAPNTFTTGLYVGMWADFSNYWIADSMAMEFQRLLELYAETNQIGLIGRLESDGQPTLAEAFVRVKLA
jgi:HK97 family phage major capsid protein